MTILRRELLEEVKNENKEANKSKIIRLLKRKNKWRNKNMKINEIIKLC